LQLDFLNINSTHYLKEAVYSPIAFKSEYDKFHNKINWNQQFEILADLKDLMDIEDMESRLSQLLPTKLINTEHLNQ